MNAPPLHLLRAELAGLSAYKVPEEPAPIKLDANESPYAPPPDAMATIAAALAKVAMHRYPDARATELRDALCARFGGSPDEYLIGTGSDEIIALLFTALAQPRAGNARPVVLFPTPTFVMFRLIGLAHGAAPVGVPLDDAWQLDIDAMRTALRAHSPSLVFLATPNNPTGNAFDTAAIETLVKEFPEPLFVVDEAYGAFSRRSARALCDRYANVAFMSTLSKIGYAATRVGFCRMHRELAVEIDKARLPFNVNALSQEVARLTLTELAPVIDAQVAAIVAGRDELVELLRAFPEFHVYPSDANFVLVRFAGDVGALASALRAKGIGVRAFAEHAERLASCVRITVGTPEEHRALRRALPDAIAGSRD